MEITTDVLLKGSAWLEATDKLSSIFRSRTNYMIYLLSMTIGIMYDKRIERLEGSDDTTKTVPRNVLQNNDNGKLDFIFQAAILSTATEELSEDDRMSIAFGDKTDFNKLAFLTQFANYGVTKLVELIGGSAIESMDNIKNFLVSTVEGRNFDIDALSDDILLDEDM